MNQNNKDWFLHWPSWSIELISNKSPTAWTLYDSRHTPPTPCDVLHLNQITRQFSISYVYYRIDEGPVSSLAWLGWLELLAAFETVRPVIEGGGSILWCSHLACWNIIFLRSQTSFWRHWTCDNNNSLFSASSCSLWSISSCSFFFLWRYFVAAARFRSRCSARSGPDNDFCGVFDVGFIVDCHVVGLRNSGIAAYTKSWLEILFWSLMMKVLICDHDTVMTIVASQLVNCTVNVGLSGPYSCINSIPKTIWTRI